LVDVHLVVVLHGLVDVVPAGGNDPDGPALVQGQHERRHLVHEQVADDAGRVPAIASPAGVDVGIPGSRAERAAPGLPVQVDPGLPAVVDGVVQPLAVHRVAAVARLAEGGLADGTGGDELSGLLVLRQDHLLGADLEDHLRVGQHDLAQIEGVVEPQRHRLLDVDVLARPQGVARHRAVPVLGGGDQHAVNVVAGQDLVVVVIGVDADALLVGARLLGAFEPRVAHVTDGDDLHVLGAGLAQAHDGVAVAAAHAAGADDTDADRLVVRQRHAGRGGLRLASGEVR
jgi:hypothetical protein